MANLKKMTTQQTLQTEDYKQTELGLLPKDWKVVRLGDVAEKMKAGGTPLRSKKEYYGGNIPFVLIEDLTRCELFLEKTKEKITEKGLENSNAWIVPQNSILLSMYATIGTTAINKIPVATNQAILAIVPKNELNPIFGAYILRFDAERLKSYNIATTQKNVNKGIVEKFLIPLPPLAEQQNIAFVLSTIQDAKEKTENYINALKEFKKSTMKHLFTYGPVAFDEIDKVELKDTEIGKMPKNWEVVKLGDVGTFQYGYTETANEKKIGPHFLRITDIDLNFSKIFWNNVPYCRIDAKDLSKYSLNEGDILIARIGATTGKTCIVKDPPESVFASYLIRFKPNLKKLSSEFAYYFAITESYWKQISANKEGKLKKGVSSSQLKTFKIPLPPLAIQQRIVSILSAIDEKIEAEEKKKKALEELFRSMLRDLMIAKLRVKELMLPEIKT